MDDKSQNILKYAFAVAVIFTGIVFQSNNIGTQNFQFYGSVGNWLISIGFIMLLVVTVRNFRKTKKVVDERMRYIADKANRITLSATFLLAFLIMIADGIHQITMPYHVFMSYFICAVLLIYIGSYKILLWRN